MGSFQVKKMRIKYLPQVYELHKDSFPNPAKARYYETLRGEKDSPFYIALNDDDEVVGYIATRLIKQDIQYGIKSALSHCSRIYNQKR